MNRNDAIIVVINFLMNEETKIKKNNRNFYNINQNFKILNIIIYLPSFLFQIVLYFWVPNFNERSEFGTVYFLLKEVPSDSLALPPVGVHRTVAQDSQVTAVCAWEKTVVMFRQPGHLTSRK